MKRQADEAQRLYEPTYKDPPAMKDAVVEPNQHRNFKGASPELQICLEVTRIRPDTRSGVRGFQQDSTHRRGHHTSEDIRSKRAAVSTTGIPPWRAQKAPV